MSIYNEWLMGYRDIAILFLREHEMQIEKVLYEKDGKYAITTRSMQYVKPFRAVRMVNTVSEDEAISFLQECEKQEYGYIKKTMDMSTIKQEVEK